MQGFEGLHFARLDTSLDSSDVQVIKTHKDLL